MADGDGGVEVVGGDGGVYYCRARRAGGRGAALLPRAVPRGTVYQLLIKICISQSASLSLYPFCLFSFFVVVEKVILKYCIP